MPEERGNPWTLQAYMEHMDRIIEDLKRYVDVRFDEADKRVAAAFLASEKAIVKQEQAQTAYNIGHNDLSRKMDDQYKGMIPRNEATILISALTDRVGVLENSAAEGQGRMWAITAIAWFVMLAITIALHFIHS